MKIHKPSLKLAGFYLGIIMLISIFFSVSVYQLSIQEIARGYRRQSALIDNFPDFPIPDDLHDQIQKQRKLEYDYAKEQVFSRLVLVNLFILVGGGMVSYFFARRTIKPIEEAREAQSRFTADASHELRTPLAVMQSETEVALMDPELSLKSAKDVLESNLEEVQRLSALSENLLELAQIGSIDFTHEKIPTSEIIEAAIRSLDPLAKEKKIKLELTNNPASTITGDKTRLIEALSILLGNAIKYSPQNSTIQITSLAKKKFIEIAVRDQGIGIDPKELPKLFDRFYRSDSARTKDDGAGGFGLGLAIAKEIAEIHGGSINVVSTKGKGSTFSLIIPKERIS